MRPDGSDFQMIIQEPIFTTILEWSPDRTWLILDCSRNGIYRIRPNGSQLESIAGSIDSTWLGWTSNHDNVVFAADDQLWTMNWMTGERWLLSVYKLADIIRPTLSPDGQWILYGTYSDQIWGYAGNYDYSWRMVRIDGWRDIRLSYAPYQLSYLVWTPDSQWLYFASSKDLDTAPSIYRIRPDATSRQLIADSAYPLYWEETSNLRWNPTQLAIIGLVTWSVGTFAPLLPRRKRLFPA